jgi:hypothetical protein
MATTVATILATTVATTVVTSNVVLVAYRRGAMSAFGPKRTSKTRSRMSAFGGKADIALKTDVATCVGSQSVRGDGGKACQ